MRKTLVSLLLALPLAAADLEFKEAFADPATRDSSLTRLVPQTRDWFFYQALHHQLAGRTDDFRRTMDAWKAAMQREDSPVDADGFQTLETRELLLRYEATPQKTVDGLVRLLDLKFDDSKPDARADEKLPDQLDPALISAQAFEAAANARSNNQAYRGYSKERLIRELDRLDTFDEAKLRHFHQELDRADHPAVVPLIAKVLELERGPDFSSARIHNLLTRRQLEELLVAVPELQASEAFAERFLTTLLPGSEVNFTLEPSAHAAHLAACRDFLKNAPPALNSLKAHVLYHHLRLQREMGEMPLEDFLAYLRIPRADHSILKEARSTRDIPRIAFDANFEPSTSCGPIVDDRELIEAYLQHFLATADSPNAFEDLIEEKTLRVLHARAKLLAGADPARWGAELDPSEVQAMQKETRIAFAPGQPVTLPAGAAVKLALDLKNTPELLVRIFELDLPGYIEREEAEPPVELDLEGLVPHHEKRLAFPQQPLAIHREVLDLPELEGAGAWIVECVSRGVSSRALVRKGRLIPYVDRQADGQNIRVFDEGGTLLKDATVSLGSETFTAGQDGRIVIPDRTGASRQVGMVRQGKLALPLSLQPRREQISLQARFHLDREQLIADSQANVLLRLQLTSHGHALPLEWIEKPSLTLIATLSGGITTERVIGGDLKLAPVMSLPFQVPADVTSLKLRLTGTVIPRDGADPLPLATEYWYAMNGILSTGRIGAVFFTRDTDGHRVELRGRNGEPLPSRPLTFEFRHRNHLEWIKQPLRSDDRGRIALGKLIDIAEVRVTGSDIAPAGYFPDEDGGWADLPNQFHLSTGEELRLPLVRFMAAPEHARVSLTEERDHVVVRDHFDKLAVENRRLITRGLPAGDFTLTLDGKEIEVKVSGGVDRDGLLVSPTRLLPRHLPSLPFIAAATEEAGTLVVRVEGATPGTRVSLVGSRFTHSWDSGSALQPFASPSSEVAHPGFTGLAFQEGSRVGDEMRYILDRRSALTFPGSMLPRPGLLVNRWSTDEIDQMRLEPLGGGGGRGTGSGLAADNRGKPTPPPGTRQAGEDGSPSLDFLAAPSVLRYDLEVGANGRVEVPAADFANCQVIDIVAADPAGRHHLVLPLKSTDTPLRDRRLARPLDAGKYHVGTRRAAALAKGAEATIESVIDADWRAFTTLEEAHQFLTGATGDALLNDFLPLLDWPSLDEGKKLAFLSEHACHELHLFLAKKDAGFFNKHVKPMLAEKREPKVIDDILLGRDLSKHLRPYAWQRLNAAEKALLAQAMPDIRERITTELKQRWELEAPAPEQETMLFTQTLRGTDLATMDSLGLARNNVLPPTDGTMAGDKSSIMNKLSRIIIPVVDFENASVEEAMHFLGSQTGINWVIRKPRGGTANTGLGGLTDPGALKIDQLELRNVPVAEVLRYICEKTRLRYKVDDYAVTLLPATGTSEDLITRSYSVSPDFINELVESMTPSETDPDDPFTSASGGGTTLMARRSIGELLKANGVVFPEGATASISGNRLVVRNTQTNIDLVDMLTSDVHSDEDAVLGAAPGSSGDDPFAPAELPAPEGMSRDSLAFTNPDEERTARPSWSSERDQTRLWFESNYYKHRGSTDESFIPLNGFWLDLAEWDGKGGFLSPHFNACAGGVNEALFCLAMLDLPFKAGRPETSVEGSTLRVKAREPMLLFYKDTRETQKIAPDAPVLVRQTFHRLDDRFRTVEGRQIENSITGDFITGVPYGASLVVTNPDGVGRRVDVISQIPAGAIPLGGQPATLSVTHELQPYGVLNLRLAFYFPAPGDFAMYPLQVSEGDTVLARTATRTLRATSEVPPVDASSWPSLARDGSADAVLERLRTANLGTLDLKIIRWRMKEPDFFKKASAILRDRLHHSPDLASFGFFHSSVPEMREYLEGTLTEHTKGFVAEPGYSVLPPIEGESSLEAGDWLDGPLLEIRPVTHLGWETLEFDPLVNPRAHRFADKERLTHEAAARYYEDFIDTLSWKPTWNDGDKLAMTAHLLMQDRIAEALARFDEIDATKLEGKLAYDYMKAVVHFHRSQPEEARTIAANHTDLPPGLWKSRFDAIVAQADEIVALKAPRPADEAKPKEEAPSLDLALAADGKLHLTHHRLDKTLLQLFSVDLEVMFSKDPFLSGDETSLPGIRANDAREVALQGGQTDVELPEAFRRGNVLVAAQSGTTKVLRVLDSRALETVRQPLDRTIQIFDSATRLPLPQTYVKVYVQGANGQAIFHKDGYTDLRGKFDYLSHTGSNLGEIRKIAVLVSHPEKGARIESFDL
ncbi:hypothetical protein OKA04_23225 [Luteolibacter flavescens]|uniref:Uncharacterized protein n=1 Tax=Luteolibacter flavescens TaxID=1859460 RepID=A0ABT3FWH0_9BACT|nr:hypothetical protein [Luteolibacter flavescens]MCW1887669.1 hypothetical protein [Luteolibacter flavescens]